MHLEQKHLYLMGDDSEVKKAKGTKKCVKKRKLMFENYKDCLFNGEVILNSQQKDLKAIIIKCTQKKLIRLC